MTHTEAKPLHGSPEWLAARHRDHLGRARLTASVAGVLFGCHPFIDPADLAVQQLKDEPPSPQTSEAMERGTALEPALLVEWERRHGVIVKRPRCMYANERWLANLDGLCADPIEAKTTTKRWTGELPEHWHWQGVAIRWCQSAIPGKVEWVILDGDLRIVEYTQHVTRDDFARLKAAGDDWLSYIDIGMPPLAVEMHAEHVQALNVGASGIVELSRDGLYWVNQLIEGRREEKDAKAKTAKAKDALAGEMAGHDIGMFHGAEVVTWKEQPGRKRFDMGSFAADHPELVDKYTTTGAPFRTMRAKGEPDDG